MRHTLGKHKTQALIIGSGQALVQLISLCRNLWFAKVLPIDLFAFGATCLLIASALEMLNDIHLDKFIIRKQGAINSNQLKAIYFINAIKGVTVAILFLLTVFVYTNFTNDTYAYSFLWMAVIPLAISTGGIRIKYFQRFSNHLPNYITEVGSQIVAVIVAIATLPTSLHDHAMMISIISVYISKLLISLIFSRFDKFLITSSHTHKNNGLLKDLIKFSSPLWINNIFLFIAMHGDRSLITIFFDHKSIAVYSLAFTVGYGIYGFMSRSSVQLLLPIYSRMKPSNRAASYRKLVTVFDSASLFVALIVLTCSANFLSFFGHEYIKLENLFALSMLTFIIRIPRIANNVILTVENKTSEIMAIGNYKLIQLLALAPLYYLNVNLLSLLFLSTLIELLAIHKVILYTKPLLNKTTSMQYVTPLIIILVALAYIN